MHKNLYKYNNWMYVNIFLDINMYIISFTVIILFCYSHIEMI